MMTNEVVIAINVNVCNNDSNNNLMIMCSIINVWYY